MTLKGKRIAILIEKQYQDLEVWFPALRLREEGAAVLFVGTGAEKVYHGKYGYPAEEDRSIDNVRPDEFDAVIIPGGFAPDFMRRYPAVAKFVQEMSEKGKLVASICHGAWILVSANILKGKTATCFSGIKDDVINAGAKYVDEEVVVDGNLITSRKPEDLPAFCKKIIEHLQK
ncbi:MAG: type 1 glutamine amidotransferase [Candidatus Saganbacteria bacterium]|nr:type 1 glutamine amidotransferase [Candidatus Saganbacteria bacterium]